MVGNTEDVKSILEAFAFVVRLGRVRLCWVGITQKDLSTGPSERN